MNKEGYQANEARKSKEETGFFALDAQVAEVMREVPYRWRNDNADPKKYEAYFATYDEGIKELGLLTGLVNLKEEENKINQKKLFDGMNIRTPNMKVYEIYKDTDKQELQERGIELLFGYDVSPSYDKKKGFRATNDVQISVTVPTYGESSEITKYVRILKSGENISEPKEILTLSTEQSELLTTFITEEAHDTIAIKHAEIQLLARYDEERSTSESSKSKYSQLLDENQQRWFLRGWERRDREGKERWQKILDAKEVFLVKERGNENTEHTSYS